MPLSFADLDDYDKIEQGDELEIAGPRLLLQENKQPVIINKTKNIEIPVKYNLSDRQRSIILEGGLLNYTKKNS